MLWLTCNDPGCGATGDDEGEEGEKEGGSLGFVAITESSSEPMEGGGRGEGEKEVEGEEEEEYRLSQLPDSIRETLTSLLHEKSVCEVEPTNNGHIGTIRFVLYREVFLSS